MGATNRKRTRHRWIIATAGVIVLAAAYYAWDGSFQSRVATLEIGLSEADVIQIMGTPDMTGVQQSLYDGLKTQRPIWVFLSPAYRLKSAAMRCWFHVTSRMVLVPTDSVEVKFDDGRVVSIRQINK